MWSVDAQRFQRLPRRRSAKGAQVLYHRATHRKSLGMGEDEKEKERFSRRVEKLMSQAEQANGACDRVSLADEFPMSWHAKNSRPTVWKFDIRHNFALHSDNQLHLPTLTTRTMPPKSTKPAAGKAGQGRSAIEDVVAREYTIHLHKRVRSV